MKLIINQEQSLRSSYLWAQMGTVLRLSFIKFVEGGQNLNLKTLGATYSIIIKYFKVGSHWCCSLHSSPSKSTKCKYKNSTYSKLEQCQFCGCNHMHEIKWVELESDCHSRTLRANAQCHYFDEAVLPQQ